MLRPMRFAPFASLVFFVVTACSCDPEPPRPPLDGGPRRDVGTPDTPGLDAPPVDADLDAGPDGCVVASDEIASEGLPFDWGAVVAASASDFAIAWLGTADANQEVIWAVVPSRGPLTLDARDGRLDAISQAPSITSTGGGYLLAWFANPAPAFDYEIYGLAVGADGAPLSAAPIRWTTNAGRDDRPSITAVGGAAIVAWVDLATPPQANVATVTAAGAIGASVELAAEADLPGSRPALSTLGTGAMAAWALAGDVVAQHLTAGGSLDGARTTLNTEHNADGSVDLAGSDLEGAIVFGVTAAGGQVRGIGLDGAGETSTVERVIAPATTGHANDPSVARWGPGWAVAYRITDEDGNSRMELAAVDSNMGVVSRIDLGAALPSGPTDVAVAADGRVAVVWTEREASSTRVELARVDCP